MTPNQIRHLSPVVSPCWAGDLVYTLYTSLRVYYSDLLEGEAWESKGLEERCNQRSLRTMIGRSSVSRLLGVSFTCCCCCAPSEAGWRTTARRKSRMSSVECLLLCERRALQLAAHWYLADLFLLGRFSISFGLSSSSWPLSSEESGSYFHTSSRTIRICVSMKDKVEFGLFRTRNWERR